jgi:hypothetical protein
MANDLGRWRHRIVAVLGGVDTPGTGSALTLM